MESKGSPIQNLTVLFRLLVVGLVCLSVPYLDFLFHWEFICIVIKCEVGEKRGAGLSSYCFIFAPNKSVQTCLYMALSSNRYTSLHRSDMTIFVP